MISLPPYFVELTPEGWWTLKDDDYIRPKVIEQRRLNWDDTFASLPELELELDYRCHCRRGVALDVGAFIGDTAPWFVNRGYDTIAFEPYPDAFMCLEQNLSRICLTDCFCLALGNGERFAMYAGDANKRNNLGGRQIAAHAEGAWRTTRIDDLGLSRVAVLKLDVEGYEPNVLAGAQKTIERDQPVIIVEYNLPALAAQGFEEHDITKWIPSSWQGREIYRFDDGQWDMIYTPGAKA